MQQDPPGVLRIWLTVVVGDLPSILAWMYHQSPKWTYLSRKSGSRASRRQTERAVERMRRSSMGSGSLTPLRSVLTTSACIDCSCTTTAVDRGATRLQTALTSWTCMPKISTASSPFWRTLSSLTAMSTADGATATTTAPTATTTACVLGAITPSCGTAPWPSMTRSTPAVTSPRQSPPASRHRVLASPPSSCCDAPMVRPTFPSSRPLPPPPPPWIKAWSKLPVHSTHCRVCPRLCQGPPWAWWRQKASSSLPGWRWPSRPISWRLEFRSWLPWPPSPPPLPPPALFPSSPGAFSRQATWWPALPLWPFSCSRSLGMVCRSRRGRRCAAACTTRCRPAVGDRSASWRRRTTTTAWSATRRSPTHPGCGATSASTGSGLRGWPNLAPAPPLLLLLLLSPLPWLLLRGSRWRRWGWICPRLNSTTMIKVD